MQRPLAGYRKEEVLMLIEVVISAYQEHMLAEHERMADKERAFFEERLSRQSQHASTGVPF
jgi:cell division septum initiation protein DivIVA